MKIYTPTTTVYAGSTIPLTFIGFGDRDPSSSHVDGAKTDMVLPWGLAAADSSLKASWAVDGDGAEIDTSTDYVTGTVHLHCRKSGVIQIRLLVEQPNSDMGKLQFHGGIVHQRFRAELNASLAITVVDEIRFMGPSTWRHNGALPVRLLIGPNSTVQLKLSE